MAKKPEHYEPKPPEPGVIPPHRPLNGWVSSEDPWEGCANDGLGHDQNDEDYKS
jgi:hypothetical protein